MKRLQDRLQAIRRDAWPSIEHLNEDVPRIVHTEPDFDILRVVEGVIDQVLQDPTQHLRVGLLRRDIAFSEHDGAPCVLIVGNNTLEKSR